MSRSAFALTVLAAACTGVEDGEDEVDIGSASRAGSVAVTWMNAIGVADSGNSLIKTATTASWNAGAASVDTIASDGYVQFTTGENTTSKMVGLSHGDSNRHYSDIDFALHLRANGTVGVYEAGVLMTGQTTYVAGDIFRVETLTRPWGVLVFYKKNGAGFRTSHVNPTSPLRVDTSLFTPGATIDDVVLASADITWQSAVAVSIVGNSLTKTGTTTGWDAGAASMETVAALDGSGRVEFTTGESTTAKMIGLSHGDTSVHYADIDFALALRANGTVAVYEAGSLRGNFGTYVAGDVFAVEVAGNAVFYSKNYLPFYASPTTATLPLLVDASLRSPGATILDAKLYTAGGTACGGSYPVANSTDAAVVARCTEITGSLWVTATGVAPLALADLSRIGDELLVGGAGVDAPALTYVGGVAEIDAPFSADALAVIAGRLIIGNTPTVALPSLTTTNGVRTEQAPALSTLELPALSTITSVSENRFVGDLYVTNTSVTTVSFPQLASIPGSLVIGGNNVMTSLDMPVLTSLGPSLYISSNPILPNCYATNLRDQLLASGWSGIIYITGNDATGTCP